MGYESKLFIVEKSELVLEEVGKRFAEVIAIYNASCFPAMADKLREAEKTDCCIYDGDEMILKDKYGKELTEASIPFVIDILEEELNKGEDYRRIKPLMYMLKGFEMEKWRELAVLHYGY